MTFDRARIVDMAIAQVGKDSRVMIVFAIPATMEGVEAAVGMLDEVRKKLPPGVDHDGNWAITARHDNLCKSKESRSMEDCTCDSLICECVQISVADDALLRSTGGYDFEIEMGETEGTSFN